MRKIPPLNGLRAFEAAARNLSFTKAAQELFVTPAAISHQIKGLEEYLGVRLFRRLTRSVILTDAAQSVLPLVSEGFDRLAQAGEVLKQSETSGVLTVSSAPTFAAKWLVLRIPDFAERYPDISIRMDARLELVDFDRDGVDVAVRFGNGDYPGMQIDRLFNEEIVPVCHPKLLDGPNPLRHPDDLKHHRLLHVDWGKMTGPLPDWNMWLASAGVSDVDPTRGPVFTVESMAISAAAQGSGVALASTYAVTEEIADGRLVIPFARSLKTHTSYWVVCPRRTANLPKIRAFREWVIEMAAATDISGKIVLS
ncbi:MAG: transcriptional regulator GcvA [Proteobacteria bacterium]|nr:transcriptional regulator GcvA [Pseudomonadota bacterium]